MSCKGAAVLRREPTRRAAIAVKAIGCALLICCSIRATPALADVSGEQRAQAAGRALIGTPAPRLVLKTIDGESIDLGSLYGKKAVYLKFWATWCVPCRQQTPHFQHAYATAGSDLAVIAIDVGFNDSVDAIRKYRRQLGITMPIVFDDGSLGRALHVRVTPTHIVIGRNGRIEYVGHLASPELDAALLAARTGDSHGPRAAAVAANGDAAGAHPAGADPAPIAIGNRLPKQSLRTIDGQRFDLGAAAPGQWTVLVFLSPWCESYLATTRPEVSANCRRAREQASALAADPHLRWLGIASGLWADSEDLRKYRTEYKVTIPLTLDASGKEFRAFRVNDVPTFLIADDDGRIVRRIEGNATQDADALRRALAPSGGAR